MTQQQQQATDQELRMLAVTIPNGVYWEIKAQAVRERKTLRQLVLDRLTASPEQEPQSTAAGIGE